MRAKVIVAITALAFVGSISAGSETLARGGEGGHGSGKSSGWAGKNMRGMHGKSGNHFPGQVHHAHGKHDRKNHHDHALGQGVWHKAGKSSDSRRDRQAGSFAGGGGYGGSVGDVCINSQFCQGVWYQVTRSGSRPSQSSATYQRNWQAGGE